MGELHSIESFCGREAWHSGLMMVKTKERVIEKLGKLYCFVHFGDKETELFLKLET